MRHNTATIITSLVILILSACASPAPIVEPVAVEEAPAPPPTLEELVAQASVKLMGSIIEVPKLEFTSENIAKLQAWAQAQAGIVEVHERVILALGGLQDIPHEEKLRKQELERSNFSRPSPFKARTASTSSN